MIRIFSLMLIIGVCRLAAGAVIGAEQMSLSENVGAVEAYFDKNDLQFQAPGEGEEISWLQILSVPQKQKKGKRPVSNMVYVPPTTLDMGSSSIQVEGFYIDPYEVTNGEYELFIRATRREPPRTWPDGALPEELKNEPVVGVTYEDAKAFSRWAGKRLPTEAEWEVAAALANKSDELSNFKEEEKPSAMTNVAEWTSSPYEETKASSRFKTIRRGTAAKSEQKIPLIDRAPMLEDDCNDFTGFRCVSDKPI